MSFHPTQDITKIDCQDKREDVSHSRVITNIQVNNKQVKVPTYYTFLSGQILHLQGPEYLHHPQNWSSEASSQCPPLYQPQLPLGKVIIVRTVWDIQAIIKQFLISRVYLEKVGARIKVRVQTYREWNKTFPSLSIFCSICCKVSLSAATTASLPRSIQELKLSPSSPAAQPPPSRFHFRPLPILRPSAVQVKTMSRIQILIVSE